MKSIKMMFGIMMIAIFTFLSLNIGVFETQAEAKVCPPGQFPYNQIHMDGQTDNPQDDYLDIICKDPVQQSTDNSKKQVGKFGEYLYVFLKVLQYSSMGIAIFLVVLAGNAYIFAQGQQQGVERAKNLLALAIVGFFLMSTSFVIMKIMTQVVGVTAIQGIN